MQTLLRPVIAGLLALLALSVVSGAQPAAPRFALPSEPRIIETAQQKVRHARETWAFKPAAQDLWIGNTTRRSGGSRLLFALDGTIYLTTGGRQD